MGSRPEPRAEAEDSEPRDDDAATSAPPSAPRVGAYEDYIAAINARDGARLCDLLPPDAERTLKPAVDGASCAARIGDSIGYEDPRGFPVWKETTLSAFDSTTIGRDLDSARLTAAIVTSFADRTEPSVESDIAYLERVGGEVAPGEADRRPLPSDRAARDPAERHLPALTGASAADREQGAGAALGEDREVDAIAGERGRPQRRRSGPALVDRLAEAPAEALDPDRSGPCGWSPRRRSSSRRARGRRSPSSARRRSCASSMRRPAPAVSRIRLLAPALARA